MSNTLGSSYRVTIFGQSHSPMIGAVIEGIPAGVTPDMAFISAFMARRAPGGALSTARNEADVSQIVSGLNERGETCGAPLCVLIRKTARNDMNNGQLCARKNHVCIDFHREPPSCAFQRRRILLGRAEACVPVDLLHRRIRRGINRGLLRFLDHLLLILPHDNGTLRRGLTGAEKQKGCYENEKCPFFHRKTPFGLLPSAYRVCAE